MHKGHTEIVHFFCLIFLRLFTFKKKKTLYFFWMHSTIPICKYVNYFFFAEIRYKKKHVMFMHNFCFILPIFTKKLNGRKILWNAIKVVVYASKKIKMKGNQGQVPCYGCRWRCVFLLLFFFSRNKH